MNTPTNTEMVLVEFAIPVSLYSIVEDMATEIVTIRTERDEWRDAAKWAEHQHQHWKIVYEAATAQRDTAIAECLEQARLNGTGSEREARLMAERDQWRSLALAFHCSIIMAAQRLGGTVEGKPTHEGNYLQRIEELVATEATLRARLAACERVVEAVERETEAERIAFSPTPSGPEDERESWAEYYNAGQSRRDALRAYRAAVAAETQGVKV